MANKDYLQDLAEAQKVLNNALVKLYSDRAKNRRIIASVGGALRDIRNAFIEDKRLQRKNSEKKQLEKQEEKKNKQKQYWLNQVQKNILRRDENEQISRFD